MAANKKVTVRYAEIAQFLGMRFNEEYCVITGEGRFYVTHYRS